MPGEKQIEKPHLNLEDITGTMEQTGVETQESVSDENCSICNWFCHGRVGLVYLSL